MRAVFFRLGFCFLLWPSFLLLAGVLLASCSGEENPGRRSKHLDITSSITHESFRHTPSVSSQNTGISGFFTSVAVIDTFLVCAELRAPYILQVYSANTYRYLGQVLKRGDSSGQCMSVANILPTGRQGIFWVYDITLGKFAQINLHKALARRDYVIENEFALSGEARRAKSPCYINDSLFASCSYMLPESRFFYFNNQSQVLRKAGELPEAGKDWPKDIEGSKFSVRASTYNGSFVKHPGNDMFVMAYQKMDRLELYEQDRLKKIIEGPDSFEPIVSFKRVGVEVNIVEDEHTRYAYTGVSITDKFIYAIYAGKADNTYCGDKLLVFDLEGRPLRSFDLKMQLCSFTVSESPEGPVIYGVENNSQTLFMFQPGKIN